MKLGIYSHKTRPKISTVWYQWSSQTYPTLLTTHKPYAWKRLTHLEKE